MLEVKFTLEADFINVLLKSFKSKYPKEKAIAECVATIKAYAPKEPFLGALELNIQTAVTAQRNLGNNTLATIYLYTDEQTTFLKECMLKAGFFWNIQQVAVQHIENRYGKEREIKVSLKALEMEESDFNEKKT